MCMCLYRSRREALEKWTQKNNRHNFRFFHIFGDVWMVITNAIENVRRKKKQKTKTQNVERPKPKRKKGMRDMRLAEEQSKRERIPYRNRQQQKQYKHNMCEINNVCITVALPPALVLHTALSRLVCLGCYRCRHSIRTFSTAGRANETTINNQPTLERMG